MNLKKNSKAKIVPIIISVSFIFFVAILFFGLNLYFSAAKTLKSGENLFKSITKNEPPVFSANFRLWENNCRSLLKKVNFIDRLSGRYLSRRYRIDEFGELAEEINRLLPELVGQEGQRTYFVLLQNDREIRPSGGFMGSYAKVKFANGGLKEVFFQDIYVPDGQAVGHVDPPLPIQVAFKQGWWKLRDSNWDPDFPSAAKTIEWFFQKGGEEKADGLIALNFSLVKEIIRVLGPLYLSDYRQSVDENNLYQVAQSHSEIDFFPGSTQKKEIIADLGLALTEKIKNTKADGLKKILGVIYKGLAEKQILMTFKNPSLNDFVDRQGWNGALKKVKPSKNKDFDDYLYWVETNLGANKANCCIKREIRHEIDFGQGKTVKESLSLFYKNEGKFSTGIPPFFWGGTYVNYLRIYLPLSYRVTSIDVNGKNLPAEEITLEMKKDFGLQELGFFVRIPAQKETTVEVNYEISLAEVPENYSLSLQKQPGVAGFLYGLNVKSKTGSFVYESEIFKDQVLNFVLGYDKIRQR